MTVGSEFEGVRPTPPGVGQRLEVRGSKEEARGFDPPDPPGKSNPALLSEYIHYNRKLKITFNFRFRMNFFLKCDVTCSCTPPSVTNCHTFSDPSPSSVTYFMDDPKFSN